MAKIPPTKPPIGSINWDSIDPKDDSIWQAKLDGAFLYYTLGKGGIRAYSYRRSKRSGKPIEHTEKLHGFKDAKVPEHMHGMILSGEAWHPDLASREVGGILNTRRKDVSESLHAAVHGIHSMPGMDISKLDNASKIRLLQGISRELKVFELPDTATSPEEKRKLMREIASGKHPQTTEGIVEYPKRGIPRKAVIEPTHDVPAVGVTLGEGKYRKKGIGAILVGNLENPTRVGTGLSDKLRKVLHENPKLVNGLVLKIKAKEKFPSGKYRSPVLVEFHPDKSDPDQLRRLDKLMSKSAGFAPGIPSSRTIQPIRETLNDKWELSIQKHDAHKAGTHFDLRLGDPQTQHSHSWVIPSMSLPTSDKRVRLAIQQPTHTMEYLEFEGEIPSGYGAGDVKLIHRDTVPVSSSSDKISFNIPGHGDMALIRRDDKKWIIVGKGMKKEAQPRQQFAYQRPNYAAIGEQKLKGGNYDAATAAGLGVLVGTGHAVKETAKDTAGVRRVHGKAKARATYAEAGAALGKTKPSTAKHRKSIAKRVGKTKIKEIGKSMLKHAPRALAAAGVTAAGLYGAKKLWGRASRAKTAGDIMQLAFMMKVSSFKTNTDPRLKVGVSPFKKSVTTKLKAPFKIQAPAVNVLSTGKSSEGPIASGTG